MQSGGQGGQIRIQKTSFTGSTQDRTWPLKNGTLVTQVAIRMKTVFSCYCSTIGKITHVLTSIALFVRNSMQIVLHQTMTYLYLMAKLLEIFSEINRGLDHENNFFLKLHIFLLLNAENVLQKIPFCFVFYSKICGKM